MHYPKIREHIFLPKYCIARHRFFSRINIVPLNGTCRVLPSCYDDNRAGSILLYMHAWEIDVSIQLLHIQL